MAIRNATKVAACWILKSTFLHLETAGVRRRARVPKISRNLADLGSRIMIVESECVYMHENCATNPSRYHPGFKMAIENKKYIF